jgi:hypothetical protein
METLEKKLWLKKAAAVTILPFAALTFTGCGEEDTAGTEEGVSADEVVEPEDNEVEQEEAVEEPAAEEPVADELAFDGIYDQAFIDDYDTLVGEVVTVSAEVNEIITDSAFTIAGTEDTGVEPLLIVHAGEAGVPESGTAVSVTGTVRDAFDVVDVESELGVELEDEAYADWEGQRYIVADSVEPI